MSNFNASCPMCSGGTFSWRRALDTNAFYQTTALHQQPLLERTCTNCGNVDVVANNGRPIDTSSKRNAIERQKGRAA